VGYWLGEQYQGKGLVTAACRALVEHAFFELGLNRAVILCATENEKSCAVAERLGFRREGVRLRGSTIASSISLATPLLRASGRRGTPSAPYILERRKGEVRRILPPRTPVKKR
jgi:hypothetical protein